jgi:hypothetical protein
MAFARSAKLPHEKLGIADDTRLLVLGVAPEGADRWPGERVPDDADVVIVGCTAASDVVTLVPAALAARRIDGRLWVTYRLGRRDFTRAILGETVEGCGLDLTWYRQVSLDAGWSAIWFRRRSEFRSLHH